MEYNQSSLLIQHFTILLSLRKRKQRMNEINTNNSNSKFISQFHKVVSIILKDKSGALKLPLF